MIGPGAGRGNVLSETLPPARCGTWRPRAARLGRSGRWTGGQFSRHRRHSVLQSTEEPDVRHPHTTLRDGRFRNHGQRPARSRRVPAGSPDRRTRSRRPHEGSGGALRRVAERHHASCPTIRPTTTAPGSATGFSIWKTRSCAPWAASTTSSSPSWTRTTQRADSRRTSAWPSGASQQASRQSGLGAGFPNHTPCVVVPPESAELPQAGRIAGQSQKGKDQDDETNS